MSREMIARIIIDFRNAGFSIVFRINGNNMIQIYGNKAILFPSQIIPYLYSNQTTKYVNT